MTVVFRSRKAVVEPISLSTEVATHQRRRRLLVVVNPHATAVSARLRNIVLHALQSCYDVQVADTAYPGHATEIARSALYDPPDAVVGFGGDGTLNEIANGLAGSTVPLVTLPGGNANVYCRMLHVPDDVLDATEWLLARADNWSLWRADLGIIGNRRFLFAAGVGLDAAVVSRVDAHPRAKATLRELAYAGSALSTFLREYVSRPPHLSVSADDQAPVLGFSVMVQNAAAYTFLGSRPIELVQGTTLDSGDVSAVVLQTHNPLKVPSVIGHVVSKTQRPEDHAAVAAFHGCRHLLISSTDGRPVPLQVDGDHIGEATEVEIGIEPKSLLVLA